MPDVEIISEPITEWLEPPRLLVEWSSRWEEFQSALPYALARSPKRLAGEAPVGMFPYRGMLTCWVLECLLLIAIIVLPARFASLQVPVASVRPQWDVIYYSGDELPRTQDRGGAQAGKTGRAGGRQAHHRTQTIRVARGDKPAEKIADAPKLKLQHSDSAVANLLAFKPVPGPPPAEGLRSSLVAPALPATSPVPPSPELQSSSRAANNLTTNVIPPAPEVSQASKRNSPTLNADNRPASAQCLARQDAHRRPARAHRRRPRSTGRPARPGQFPRAPDSGRRGDCATGFRARARHLLTIEGDAPRPRSRRASAVAGHPRSQQLGKLRYRRLAPQARTAAANCIGRRLASPGPASEHSQRKSCRLQPALTDAALMETVRQEVARVNRARRSSARPKLCLLHPV